jgi:hypothetical protein
MVTATNWNSAAARRLVELSGIPATGQKTISRATIDKAIEVTVSTLIEGCAFPPTDLNAVASRVGVDSITRQDDMVGSGELRDNHGRFEIAYSGALNAGRRRFTIAHEFGHVILASCGTACSGSKELERLCDRIGAEILMPHACFRRFWTNDVSITDVFKIARVFQTSITATATRAHELFGAVAFEIRDGSVEWRKGILDSDLRELRDPIRDALRGNKIDEHLYMRTRVGRFEQFRLQGMRIGEKQAFFLATQRAPTPA